MRDSTKEKHRVLWRAELRTLTTSSSLALRSFSLRGLQRTTTRMLLLVIQLGFSAAGAAGCCCAAGPGGIPQNASSLAHTPRGRQRPSKRRAGRGQRGKGCVRLFALGPAGARGGVATRKVRGRGLLGVVGTWGQKHAAHAHFPPPNTHHARPLHSRHFSAFGRPTRLHLGGRKACAGHHSSSSSSPP